MGAISDALRAVVDDDEVLRLMRVGYMSPQDSSFTGQGFACERCDWYRGFPTAMPTKVYNLRRRGGKCVNPNVQSVVEAAGCCNLFRYHGVSTD